MTVNKKAIGDQAEQLACAYLMQQGLILLKANFSIRLGEIDLIMRDTANDMLVFVEVRYRKNNHYGGAAGSVTVQKQRKIIKTAAFYLQRYVNVMELLHQQKIHLTLVQHLTHLK
jgi:putative endonuclease